MSVRDALQELVRLWDADVIERGGGNLQPEDDQLDAAWDAARAALAAEQEEPVAWMHPVTSAVVHRSRKIPGVTLDDFTIPLYAAPCRGRARAEGAD